jgi:hypothetical protein
MQGVTGSRTELLQLMRPLPVLLSFSSLELALKSHTPNKYKTSGISHASKEFVSVNGPAARSEIGQVSPKNGSFDGFRGRFLQNFTFLPGSARAV